MKGNVHMKTISNIISAALLASFALLPQMQAVVPPPDGCYPGFTTAEGCGALNSLTSGAGNTGLGWRALFSNSTGSFNTGVGGGALVLNNGDSNTALGAATLLLNSTGVENTAVGTAALIFNDTGSNNTAFGAFALSNNTEGDTNTATGEFALYSNTTGGGNVATGYNTLYSNTTGVLNTAIGGAALHLNTTGNFNVATGILALEHNTTGDSSTGIGTFALQNNTEGESNTATGFGALFHNTTGNNNTAIGSNAGSDQTTGSGNVYIGADVVGSDPETDHTYIRNINNTSVSGGGTDTVTINLSTGLLGHLSSSRRHKEDIQPMTDASETLYRLKPVTYRYKKEIDVTRSLDYGLVAEEVAAVDPNLVACDKNGQIETVRYTAVNAMLLNEFLKEHRKNEEQALTIAHLEQQIQALTAGLQKVSAQLATSPSRGGLEVSESAPQMLLNNQ